MLKDFSLQSLFMGCLTAFVGFASSFAVVLQGLKAVGATDFEAASGLMALSSKIPEDSTKTLINTDRL